MTDIIAQENLPTTAYKYNGRLDYDTSYFWQVTAAKPVPSEPSPVFGFTTTARPSPQSAPSLPYYQILHWLQASVLINILGFSIVVAMMALFMSRRNL